jgi:hypothetical protein
MTINQRTLGMTFYAIQALGALGLVVGLFLYGFESVWFCVPWVIMGSLGVNWIAKSNPQALKRSAAAVKLHMFFLYSIVACGVIEIFVLMLAAFVRSHS